MREVTFKDRTARYELIDEHGDIVIMRCVTHGTTEHIDDPAIEGLYGPIGKKFKHIKKLTSMCLNSLGYASRVMYRVVKRSSI